MQRMNRSRRREWALVHLLLPIILLVGCGAPSTVDAAAPRPSEPPYMTAEVLAADEIHPRTENCSHPSEADTNNDGFVTSNDGPVCNPNPSHVGSIHVRGFREDQGGDGVERDAGILHSTPIAKETAEGVRAAKFVDVQVGDEVMVWEGPGGLGESDPLYGDASYVLILRAD